jgi:hypothetical protein
MARRRLLGLLTALALLVAPVGATVLARVEVGARPTTERVAAHDLHPHGAAVVAVRTGHERRASLRFAHVVAALHGTASLGLVAAWTGRHLDPVGAVDVSPTASRSRAPPAFV